MALIANRSSYRNQVSVKISSEGLGPKRTKWTLGQIQSSMASLRPLQPNSRRRADPAFMHRCKDNCECEEVDQPEEHPEYNMYVSHPFPMPQWYLRHPKYGERIY